MITKQKTAIDQLVNLILKHDKSFLEFYNAEIVMAKEIEKKQIIKAIDSNYTYNDNQILTIGEQYYNKTYGGKNE